MEQNEERWESAKTRSSGTEHFGKSSGTERVLTKKSSGTEQEELWDRAGKALGQSRDQEAELRKKTRGPA